MSEHDPPRTGPPGAPPLSSATPSPGPTSDGPRPPPVVPEDQRVAPDLLRAIQQMLDDVARRPYSKDLTTRLEMLIDVLVMRGHLTAGHQRLLGRVKGGDASTVRLSVFADKRSVPSSDVDCATLLPLCRGRCCAMDVSLSAQDVAEGKLEWDLNQPYLLRKNPEHGYCAHIDEHRNCSVYDERPGTCRAYDCRRDPRVWIDYEQRIPAPLPWHLEPPDVRARGAPAMAGAAGDGDEGETGDGQASGAGPTITT